MKLELSEKAIAEIAIDWWAKAVPTQIIAEFLGCQPADVGYQIICLKHKLKKLRKRPLTGDGGVG